MPVSFSAPTISDVADIRAHAEDYNEGFDPWTRLKLTLVGKDGSEVQVHAYFDGEARGRAHEIAALLSASEAK